jgi:hypothetical protein
VAFVLQAGDLVEGLCGTEELARRHNREAMEFVEAAQLGVPFLFVKGNHDITGPGAPAAYADVFHPWQTAQARAVQPDAAAVTDGNYAVQAGSAQFAFFDAYDAARSLERFEALVARRTAEHLFVAVHPPVVPYGARSTWHLFASSRDRARREKLLALLGDQEALVLGGHIHKYSTIGRRAGRGVFAQFALSSVLGSATVQAKHVLDGLAAYTGAQIAVEPNFSPASADERRAVYDAERGHVREFAYADLPGYAVVRVAGPRVRAEMYAGATAEVWRSFDLTALRSR